MENKSLRLAEIKKIIQVQRVTSQDQLLQLLISSGFVITQATLSRDLKQMQVAKVPDGRGAYRYVLPEAATNESDIASSAFNSSLNGFISLEFSGNMGVIRTVEAFSHTVALKIDKARMPEIAGTISGEDTIMFVVRQGYTTEQVTKALTYKFPELVHKLL